jgi:hypothetical protein
MHIVDDEDIALIPMSPRSRATFMKIDLAIKDLTKRLDAQDATMGAALAKQEAFNERRDEDERIRKEYAETGRTPTAVYKREGIERHRYLNRRDDA